MSNDKGWLLGKVAGAPVLLRPSALVMVAVFAALYYPLFADYASSSVGAVLAAVVLGLAILASVFVHEVSHASVARSFGNTADEISLTLLGGHAAFSSAFRRPWHGALTAIAGPVANVVVGLVVLVVSHTLTPFTLTAQVVGVVAVMNFFLAAFNALPGLPLDGGSAVSALIWNFTGSQAKGLRVAARVGQAIAVVWLAWSVVRPLALGLGLDYVLVMWTVILTVVLWNGASASLKRAELLAAIEKVSLAQVMSPALVIGSWVNVAQLPQGLMTSLTAVDTQSHGPRKTCVVLDQDGAPSGYVDVAAVLSVEPSAYAYTPIAAVSIPLLPGSAVSAQTTVTQLVQSVQVGSLVRTLFVVVDAGQVRGVVWVADLMRALDLH